MADLEKKEEEEKELRQSSKKVDKSEKTEKEQQLSHQSIALRKAALLEAKSAKRHAKK